MTRFRLFTYCAIIILLVSVFRKDSEIPHIITTNYPIGNIGNVYGTNSTIKKLNFERSQRVVQAFRHSWQGYYNYAFGYDEFHPLSKTGSDWFGLGLTIIDCLDTALIMNQSDIYSQARMWVAGKFSLEQEGESNVFEITIRVLGGLLSTFGMTNDQMYLGTAVALADRLLVAFDTKTGIPLSSINLKRKLAISAGFASLAEATTLQMEFKYLTWLTKDPKYWNACQKVMQKVFEQPREDGLCSVYIDTDDGHFLPGSVRLGSRGDSYYEYLAKQWMLTGYVENIMKAEYETALEGIRKVLLGISAPSKLLFIGETSTRPREKSSKMDHLVCFLPGILAWKAADGKLVTTNERHKLTPQNLRDLQLAEELTKSCVEMYFQTPTGLAPEIVFWNSDENSENDPIFKYHQSKHVDLSLDYPVVVPDNDQDASFTRFTTNIPPSSTARDFVINPADGHNLLRPETIESLFILYRITGKEQYRTWGWQIFLAFEKYCKVESGGYASLVYKIY